MDFTNTNNGAADGGLRFRGSITGQRPTQQQQQQQSQPQRPPPPKASMSMGYMPVLVDETLFPDDKKKTDSVGDTMSPPAASAKPATTAVELTTMTFPTASTTTASISATDASRWVLITGYVTKAHYELIRRRFALAGNVLHTRGVCQEGRSNWYAVQYETRMEAEQALSLGTFMLVDGIWISVNRVTPQLLAMLDTNHHSGKSSNGSLFPTPDNGTTQHNWGLLEAQPRPALLDYRASNGDDLTPQKKTKTWDESEIYVHPHLRSTPNNKQQMSQTTTGASMCDKIMNWIFGWDSYES